MSLNEFFAWQNFRAHKNLEHPISFLSISYGNLKKHPVLRVTSCLPQLPRIHFSQTFVALNCNSGYFIFTLGILGQSRLAFHWFCFSINRCNFPVRIFSFLWFNLPSLSISQNFS